DCGDAGHILVSKRVADDLEQYPQWRPQLHDLGECEVKHGVLVHAVNLYTDELGNPEVQKIQSCKGRGESTCQVSHSQMGIDRRSDPDPRRHCLRFSFLATTETENFRTHVSDSGKIDRGIAVRKSKPRS